MVDSTIPASTTTINGVTCRVVHFERAQIKNVRYVTGEKVRTPFWSFIIEAPEGQYQLTTEEDMSALANQAFGEMYEIDIAYTSSIRNYNNSYTVHRLQAQAL